MATKAFTKLVIAGRGVRKDNEIYYRHSPKPPGPFAGQITRTEKIMGD